MAYRITLKDRSLQKAFRRIACEQIDAALAELTAPQADPNEAIHQTRKHFKKLRGLLRLVRPGFDDYDRENAAIRDLAATLSGLRDTGALVETHDRLMVTAADGTRFDPVRAHLVARAPGGKAPLPLPEGFCDALRALRDRASAWTLRGKDGAILRAGLALTWARAAAGYRAASKDSSPANIHEWRKRVKYNWYHSRLLRDINKRRVQPHREAAKRLAGLLGEHHDIAVYLDELDRLAQNALPAITPALIADLKSRALDRKSRLEADALAIGAAMTYEKPGKLPKLWIRWWKDWRRG